MALASTQFDRRIAILRSATVDTGMGRKPGAPTIWKKFWAQRVDVSDGEKVRAAQVGSSIDVRFMVRSSADTLTISGTDKLQCDGQTFNVLGTKEAQQGRRAAIEISCSATKGATT